MSRRIQVTQPSLAPLPEYVRYLRRIWRSGVMTHNGPLMQKLERRLAARLGVPDAVCVANGTCAMQLAIRALGLSGEIITTPFTFIATASIIAWERCKPVFVDIDPATWNIDPGKIEGAVTRRTSAVLPVHVFGAPCDVKAIGELARRRRLKVIYDAAHGMDVDCGGRSLASHGDLSCLSFHATKLFNTAEGGACVARDPKLSARLRRLRFFGFDEAKEVVDEGMNAKMTEVAAALGLANLPRLDAVKRLRRAKYERYRAALADCPFLTFQAYSPEEYNYCYLPVVFDSEKRLLAAESALKARNIFPRRYFHPALHTLKVFGRGPRLPVAERIARAVLCLPLYGALADSDIDRICGIVRLV